MHVAFDGSGGSIGGGRTSQNAAKHFAAAAATSLDGSLRATHHAPRIWRMRTMKTYTSEEERVRERERASTRIAARRGV